MRIEKPPIYYLRIYAWKRKMGIQLREQERADLAAYERKNGRLPGKRIDEWMGL